MAPKRKRETLEEIKAKCFCWYCEKTCSDLKALQDHQKAKHLQCQVSSLPSPAVTGDFDAS